MGVMVFLFLMMAFAPQDDAKATDAITAFESNFSKSKDASSRAGAVATLAQTHHEKVIARLGSLLTHEDKGVRIAAAQGLAGLVVTTPELKKSASHHLVSALTSGANVRDEEVMIALFSALGNLQEESAGSAIKNHFEDKNPKIAGAAANAAGALKSKTMVDPLIELLRECEKNAKSGTSAPAPASGGKGAKMPKTPKGGGGGGGGTNSPDPDAAKRDRASALIPAVQAALQTLTGQGLSGADEWEKWWSKNKSSFTPNK
jgi:hypothetical protein